MLNPVRSLLLALLVVLAVLPAASADAKRQVPPGFFGVMADGPLLAPETDLGAEMDLMVDSGVESMRVAFYWADAQPYATMGAVPESERGRFVDVGGVPTNFDATDRIVAATSARHIRVLPIVIRSPAWAASNPSEVTSPPADPATYGRFLIALAQRYGPGGTFFSTHPDIDAYPIRDWQIWNEPNITRYWSEQPFAPKYVNLLRTARAALRSVNPRAKVILSGLANFSWRDLASIYRAGGKGSFDAAAVHPYTGKVSGSLEILRRNRAVMNRNRDRRTPIWATEVTWSSALGKTQNTLSWETTEAGQASRLRALYPTLIRHRRALRLDRVFWYTWLTPDQGSPNSFDWSGLRKQGTTYGALENKPALSAFRAVTRRFQGCSSGLFADRCR